jgi:CubicO group peptidase (beta-lactamase class C family)
MSVWLRRLKALGVAAGLVAAPAAAQTARPAQALTPEQAVQVDQAVAAYMSRTRAPGAAAAVVRGGETAYARGYGLADLASVTPATTQTVWRLASVSKPITAAAVLQLAEEGRIGLDVPVRTYVPTLPATYDRVTVRDLLRHTGGVRTYRGDEFFSRRRCETLGDALAVFGGDPLDHPPGARQTYSTYGYTVLGLAVEGAARRRFTDVLRSRVLRPAGMRRTTGEDARASVRGRATPYVRLSEGGVGPARAVDNSCKVPGGGLAGSLDDVAGFAAALQTGKLIGPAALAEMTRNQLSPEVVAATLAGQAASPAWGYGLGLQTGTARRTEAVLHTGGGAGATTVLYFLPAQQTAVVVLSNIQDAGPDITRLADDIADAVAPAPAPTEPPPETLPPAAV